MKKSILSVVLCLSLLLFCLTGCAKTSAALPDAGISNMNIASGGWYLEKDGSCYICINRDTVRKKGNGLPVKLGFGSCCLNDFGDKILLVNTDEYMLALYDPQTGKLETSGISATTCSLIDGYIYYANSEGTYRMAANDWSQSTLIHTSPAYNIQKWEDTIYVFSSYGTVWKIGEDSEEPVCVYAFDNCYGMAAFTEDGLLFTAPGSLDGVNRMIPAEEGTEYNTDSEPVITESYSRFVLTEHYIYYVVQSEDSSSYVLKRCAIGSDTCETVKEDVRMVLQESSGSGKVIYQSFDGDSVYSIDEAGTVELIYQAD